MKRNNKHWSLLSMVCTGGLLAMGCGAGGTLRDVLHLPDVHTVAELQTKMGEPCTVVPRADGSEVWMYCVHVGRDEREFQAACHSDCPQRYEFSVRSGIVTSNETAGLP